MWEFQVASSQMPERCPEGAIGESLGWNPDEESPASRPKSWKPGNSIGQIPQARRRRQTANPPSSAPATTAYSPGSGTGVNCRSNS